MRALAVLAGLALLAPLAGCYDAPLPTCGFLCGEDDLCPSGYTCNNGAGGDFRCYAQTPLPGECEPVDANGPPTVREPPLQDVVEAGFSSITFAFSEVVTGVDDRTVRLARDDGELVTSDVTSWIIGDVTNAQIRFAPEALAVGRSYTLAVSGAIRDAVGYRVRPFRRTFSVIGDQAPSVVSRDPEPDSTFASVRPVVAVEFSEPVVNVTADTFFLTGPSGIVETDLEIPIGDNSYWVERFRPVPQLAPSTIYYVTLSDAITDSAGNAVPFQRWSFTTGIDAIAPRVLDQFPPDGKNNVPLDVVIALEWDEPVIGLDATTLRLWIDFPSTPVATTVTFDAFTRIARITPQEPLLPLTTYRITTEAGIRDASGNQHIYTPTTFITAAN